MAAPGPRTASEGCGPDPSPWQSLEAPAGVVLERKPAGVTSHDVVAGLRRRLRRGVKVGHAGTLDPFATGLLVLLIGRGTRAQRYLLGLTKAYQVTARLGWTSTTGDRDGELRHTGRVARDPQIATGDLMQRPPAYSAVKVGGEALYRKARRGEAVEGEPRPVHVSRADLLERDGDLARYEVECSSGTYVRQLVADLDDAYCEELERTRVGPFTLADADAERLIPLGEALSFIPARELDAGEARRVAHGVRLAAAGERGPVRMMHDGELVAIGEPAASELAPVVVFAG